MTKIKRKAEANPEKEEVAMVTMVTGAEKQAIRLRRMPMFFEHPRNGKEIKDFCHFGSRKGKGCRVQRVRNVVS